MPRPKRVPTSVQLEPPDMKRVAIVQSWMLCDPQYDGSRRISRQEVLRYALRRCVEHPPAHVGVRQG